MLNVLVLGETEQHSGKTLELLADGNHKSITGMQEYAYFFITYDNAHKHLTNLHRIDMVIFDGLHTAPSPSERVFLSIYRECEVRNIPIACTAFDNPKDSTNIREIVCNIICKDHPKSPSYLTSGLLSTELLIARQTGTLMHYLSAALYYTAFVKKFRTHPAA